MLRKFLIGAFACASFCMTANAYAHDGATGVVKERMDLMKIIAKNTKAIAPIATGAADMDLKTVEQSALAIQQAAKKAVLKFPKGSMSEVSEARETIWQDWEKFVASMRKLSEDAGGMVALAKAEEEFEIEAAFGKLTSNCKSCHTAFRIKK